jgi:lipoate-protein ligase A
MSLPEGQTTSESQMAIDEAILEAFVVGDSAPTVRVYRWLTPCVTIGKNQNMEEARGSYPSFAIYRRPTGGRAVVHGDDLTVSVIASEKSVLQNCTNRGILATYQHVLSGILDTLRSYEVSISTGNARGLSSVVSCFASVGKCDVVDEKTGIKIVGSAQLRSRGAILQQMSIRTHERYHINEEDFVWRLKHYLQERLAVDQWEPAFAMLPSENRRSGILLNTQVKGANFGTENSYM